MRTSYPFDSHYSNECEFKSSTWNLFAPSLFLSAPCSHWPVEMVTHFNFGVGKLFIARDSTRLDWTMGTCMCAVCTVAHAHTQRGSRFLWKLQNPILGKFRIDQSLLIIRRKHETRQIDCSKSRGRRRQILLTIRIHIEIDFCFVANPSL